MMATTTENLTAQPSPQLKSTPFWTFVSSAPVGVVSAILLTKLAIVVLGDTGATAFTQQIWTACLGSGFIGSALGGFQFMRRSDKLTDAKIANNSPVAAPLVGAVSALVPPQYAPVAAAVGGFLQGDDEPENQNIEVIED